MVGNAEAYVAFKAKLETLPENVVVIASHTQTDNRKEKVSFSCLNPFPNYRFVCICFTHGAKTVCT